MSDWSFVWGAGTSAHQVEGNNIHNDWWAWEKQRSTEQDRSGRAVGHFERFAEDFALAKSLGHNAHRLSLEWSRLEPVEGQWSTRAIDHYRQVLVALRAQGLASFVTLHHFTNPLWLARQGGWESARVVQHFARYTRHVVQQLGDLVDFWVTINEPVVYASNSWLAKRWPPQQHSWWSWWQVMRHLAQAHMVAYQEIHRALPLARVGLASHLIAFQSPLSSYWFNHYFLRLTRGSHDWLGVNYYFTAGKHWQGATSDLGWPINPAGLTQVLLELRRYRLPIYVTENGLADARDAQRADFIRDHVRAVENAQAAGANVRGYLHWSLLDNFEWDLGFAPRFGLVAVDYASQKRTPRPSAYVYKAIIEQAKK